MLTKGATLYFDDFGEQPNRIVYKQEKIPGNDPMYETVYLQPGYVKGPFGNYKARGKYITRIVPDNSMKRQATTQLKRPTKKGFTRPMTPSMYKQIYAKPSVQPSIIRYQQTHQGGEIKSLDVINSTTTTTNSAAAWPLNATAKVNCINLITIGSSQWNRIGRKVSLKSFRIRGFLNPTGNNSAGSSGGPIYSRMILLYDKQPNGALPVLADILLDQVSLAADSSSTLVTSGINMNNRDRFEILMDQQFVVPPCNTSTGAVVLGGLTATADLMHFDRFINLKGRETHYKADSSPAVIGDVATGSLVMITFGNCTAATEPYQLLASIRLRYSDL